MQNRKPDTIAEVAAAIAAMDAHELARIASTDFLEKSPTQESWRKPLAVFFPRAAVERHFQAFMQDPKIDDQFLKKYVDYFEWYVSEKNCNGFTRPAEGRGIAFNPQAPDTTLTLDKRITMGDAVYALGLLKENPDILVTIAALQSFYVDYIKTLRKATKAARNCHGEQAFTRHGLIFDRFEGTFSGNEALFGGVMGLHFMLVHGLAARKEGRPAGVLQPADFAAFMGYATYDRLFMQDHGEGKKIVCPFARYFRKAANAATDADAHLPAGLRLMLLHDRVAGSAAGKWAELHKSLVRIYWSAVNNFDVDPKNLFAPSGTIAAATAASRPDAGASEGRDADFAPA